jgi:hypothetical protein
MGLPALVFAEGLGSFGLNAQWLKKTPKFIRLSFGVFWVLICMAIFSLIIGLLTSMVGVSP